MKCISGRLKNANHTDVTVDSSLALYWRSLSMRQQGFSPIATGIHSGSFILLQRIKYTQHRKRISFEEEFMFKPDSSEVTLSQQVKG